MKSLSPASASENGCSSFAVRLHQKVFESKPENFDYLQEKALTDLRAKALQGDLSTLEQSDLWRAPLWKLSVYLSATHSDTIDERDIVFNEILPHLKLYGRRYDIDVSIIYMKLDTAGELVVDNRMWLDRRHEIVKCIEESTGVCFVTLLFDKYGYMPLSHCIAKEIVESQLQRASHEQNIFSRWYELDTNANPELYMLKDANQESVSFWTESLPKLFQALENTFEIDKDILPGRSLVEWEVKWALNNAKSKISGVHWFHRSFHQELNEILDNDENYIDTFSDILKRDRLNKLKFHLHDRLQQDQIHEYLELDFKSMQQRDGRWHQYLNAWGQSFCNCLKSSLNDIITQKSMWTHNGCGLGLNGFDSSEILLHMKKAVSYYKKYIPRDKYVKMALAEIQENYMQNNFYDAPYRCVNLAFTGARGIGKSHFLASLAFEINSTQAVKRPILIRFCGISPSSSNGLGLIRSIIAQIHYIFEIPSGHYWKTAQTSEFGIDTYDATVRHFQSLLKSYAVVLILDGLENISDHFLARSQLSFLKNFTPHKDTRIIVSCSSDENDVLSYAQVVPYGCEARLLESGVTELKLKRYGIKKSVINHSQKQGSFTSDVVKEPITPTPSIRRTKVRQESFQFNKLLQDIDARFGISEDEVADELNEIEHLEDGMLFLQSFLAEENRTLTGEQYLQVKEQVIVDSSVLYLHLAAHVIKHWTSFCEPVKIIGGAKKQFDEICNILSSVHGKEITNTALGLLSYCICGLKDSEMIDILKANDSVFDSFIHADPAVLTSVVSTRKRYSIANCWLTLRADLLSYGLIVYDDIYAKWGHGEFSAFCKERYSAQESKMFHMLLGFYFGDLMTKEKLAQRRISSQPLVLNADFGESNSTTTPINHAVWNKSAVVNRRRCLEAGSQLLNAGLFKESMNEICSIDAVFAYSRCGEGILRWFDIAAKLLLTEVMCDRLEHYFRWISESMSDVLVNPLGSVISSCTLQPISSLARKDMLYFYASSEHCNHRCAFSDDAFIRCVVTGGPKDFMAMLGTLRGHSHSISKVQWSRDGERLISSSWDHTVKIWDALNGRLISSLEGHNAVVTSVCYSSDNTMVASSSWDNNINIWAVATQEVLMTINGHDDYVTCVDWRSDDSMLASSSYDSTVKLWNAKTGQLVVTFDRHTNWVTVVAWSPDGKFVASGSCDKKGHHASVLSLQWSPDGKILASGALDRRIKLWDTEGGLKTLELDDMGSQVNALAWSIDSKYLAIGTNSNAIRVFNVQTSKFLAKMEAHTGYVTSLSWSCDGRKLASASIDKTLQLWDTDFIDVPIVTESHGEAVSFLTWSPDGSRLLSVGEDCVGRIWIALTTRLDFILKGHSDIIHSASWSPNGIRILTASQDSSVRLWDAHNGIQIGIFSGHTDIVHSVEWCCDSRRFAVGTGYNAVRIYDAVSNSILFSMEEVHSVAVYAVSWNLDGTKLASGSGDTTIRIWDAKHGTPLKVLRGHKQRVTSVQWCKLEKEIVASGSFDGTIKLWNAIDGILRHSFGGHQGKIFSISLSNMSNFIASACDNGKIGIWDFNSIMKKSHITRTSPDSVENEEIKKEYTNSRPPYRGINQQDNSKEVDEEYLDYILEGHYGDTTTVSWHPHHLILASGSKDKSVRLWDAIQDQIVLHQVTTYNDQITDSRRSSSTTQV